MDSLPYLFLVVTYILWLYPHDIFPHLVSYYSGDFHLHPNRGLQFLQGLGVSSVLIESDSLELIQACNRKIEVWTPHAAILAESFMNASTINGVAFQHCLREANVVAHQLAKYVYQTKENFIWEGDPPSFLLPFVINDVTIVEV